MRLSMYRTYRTRLGNLLQAWLGYLHFVLWSMEVILVAMRLWLSRMASRLANLHTTVPIIFGLGILGEFSQVQDKSF